MKYRTLWYVRHVMPDDRLVTAKIDPEDGVVTLGLRHGHIHPALAQNMSEFSKAFAESGPFELDPTHFVDRPELQAWVDRVDERHTDGVPLVGYFGGTRPWFFEIHVREDMVDPALIREMNEEMLPLVCGLLVPVVGFTRN